MAEYPHPQTLLKKYGFAAKKSWGQNFLVGESVYDAIVGAAKARQPKRLVEIGAGLGTLTVRLGDALGETSLVAVERDPDMVKVLEGELTARKNIRVQFGDALQIDYAALALGEDLLVVGNLPYQIASPLLFAMAENRGVIRHAIVMLQKEHAERLWGEVGTKRYSALTVLIGAHARVQKLCKAPASAFLPPPKVDSLVVTLEFDRPEAPRYDIADYGAFRRVVNAAFGQRRKTLRNAVGSLPGGREALERAGIDGQRRGETLSIAEFATVANSLYELEGDNA